MNRLACVLSFLGCLWLSGKPFAQNIKTAKDSIIYIDCAPIPMLSNQYFMHIHPLSILASSSLSLLSAGDSSNFMAIYNKVGLALAQKQLERNFMAISLNSSDKQTLKRIKRNLKKQGRFKSKYSPVVSSLCCAIELLQNHKKKALHYWNLTPNSNPDLLRLISFFFYLKQDYLKALFYLKQIPPSEQSTKDQYLLGWLTAYQQNWQKAYAIFDNNSSLNSKDDRIQCAKMSILIHQHQFEKAFQLIQNYPSSITDNIYAFHINYYTALATLAQGDMNDAFKRLKSIHAQSQYKTCADRLLTHFFLTN
ncbi:hypothetical protein [Aureispira anguillae]|uniref:Tetratricopeptide repeat protein n=1 Tax=Aureispira anguillae TaxID=2864201 RepID=A0A916DTX1_9BACT|nr:hypothetical protein [Aureispira anguillae]BDS11801.1 hypothetical protein AsAng_0025150 [Aureispira anguillae]